MPDSTSASEALRSLADQFWDAYLATYPGWATVVGDRRFDDRLEDLSPSAIAARGAWLDGVAAAATAIDGGALSDAEQVTRQMLIDEATGQAEALRTGLHDWTVDPLSGPTVSLLDLVEYQTIRTPDDGRNMVARWRAIDAHLAQVDANLARAAGDGLVAVINPVERAIDVLRALEALPAAEWKLAAPASAALEGWSDADRATFRAELLAAVSETAIPAFRRHRHTLESVVMPRARPSEKPGLVHLPGGADAYRAMVRVHTTLDLDPAEVHATGLAEIERIDAEFVELGRRVLGTTDLGGTLAALRDDPGLRFSTADEVFDTARRSLARAQAAIGGWFGRIPSAACVVVPVPSHSEVHQTIAYYAWPAMDGSRPGRYYINLHAPETRPRYEAEALAFHEAVPGHHLQIAVAQELEGLPAFQRMLGSTAFAEGWGLYTERLSDEMGLYSSDMDRFGILSYDAWRAGRLVVDTGIHAFGWTRQEAIDFLARHSALGVNNIANEVDRYIVWPGQALAYKVGQLELVRLRAEAERRLDGRFDIRAFHDTVLGAGAVSLPALRGRVERWVDDQAAGLPAQPDPG
jgi:uncharacterized protein (DUF885 family)